MKVTFPLTAEQIKKCHEENKEETGDGIAHNYLNFLKNCSGVISKYQKAIVERMRNENYNIH